MKNVSAGKRPVRPFHYAAGRGSLSIDHVSLERLAEKFGTPLYVYSAAHIATRYELFSAAFARRPHIICYSVKANSNLSILRLLARMGSGFDIVSGGELERVLAADSKAAGRVVFSGVGKRREEVDLALKAGILLFNIESEEEAALLTERAAKLRKRPRVALRVNPDIEAKTHPYISTGLREHKFGIGIAAAPALYRSIAMSGRLEPAGISVHIGSQIRSAEPFGAAMARVAELARMLRGNGISIRYIDAGGGLGIDYGIGRDAEAASGSEGPDPAREVQRYATAIDRALGGLEVKLLLEPGRFLVAQAGALLTRVLYTKKNGRKSFVIVDAGMNDLIRPALYQAHHEILPVKPETAKKRGKAEPSLVDVVGPVCETGDFFARDRRLPAMKSGDLAAILDTGAYGMSLSSNYNTRPRPAEVLVSQGKSRLIRPRETARELFAAEERVLRGRRR